MPPELVALSEGPSILLDKPILLIGRHQECDIQIPSRKISRRHCCIAQVNDHLVVRDLCSTNGVRINGVRVMEGHLKAGDELTIGNFRYELRWNAEEPGPRRPQPPLRERRQDATDNPFLSLDEPFLLKDSGNPLVPGGLVPQAPGVNPPPAQAQPASPENPFAIPDHLELASASGEIPPDSKKV
jgi:predicted component of type VI protein secretion system